MHDLHGLLFVDIFVIRINFEILIYEFRESIILLQGDYKDST